MAPGLDFTLVESWNLMRMAQKGSRTPHDPVPSGAATAASGRMTAPLSAVPPVANWEMWHGQS
jgi:hypothetical protein